MRGAKKMNSSESVKSKNAKIKKKQNKIIAQKLKKSKLGLVPMLAIVVIITLISIKIFQNLDSIGKNGENIESLKKEYNHLRINNEAWKQKIDAPLDDEYIIEIAKDEGYWGFDEDVYYFNESE
jgi:cell division protein FtsB